MPGLLGLLLAEAMRQFESPGQAQQFPGVHAPASCVQYHRKLDGETLLNRF
jgi:hypothetical protein